MLVLFSDGFQIPPAQSVDKLKLSFLLELVSKNHTSSELWQGLKEGKVGSEFSENLKFVLR